MSPQMSRRWLISPSYYSTSRCMQGGPGEAHDRPWPSTWFGNPGAMTGDGVVADLRI